MNPLAAILIGLVLHFPLVTLATPVLADRPVPRSGSVTREGAALRSGPGEHYSLLTRLPRGAMFAASSEAKDGYVLLSVPLKSGSVVTGWAREIDLELPPLAPVSPEN